MGDVDVNAMRLQEEPGMSRDEVRDFYAQYQSRIDTSAESDVGDKANLKIDIDNEVKQSLREDEEYITAEVAHATLLDDASKKLAELQEAGKIPDTVAIPFGYSAHKCAKIIDLFVQFGEDEEAQTIRDAARKRSLHHKRIRHRLQQEIRQRREKAHRALLKKNKASAAQVVSAKGAQPKNVTAAGPADLGDSTDAVLQALADIPDDDGDAEEVAEDVDGDVLEEQEGGDARQEPESWEE